MNVQRLGLSTVPRRLVLLLALIDLAACNLPRLDTTELVANLEALRPPAAGTGAAPALYSVAATVAITGLHGTLELTLNGVEISTMTTSGVANFATPLADGDGYTIAGTQRATFAAQIAQQDWITQTCVLSGTTSGTISGTNATPSITITCTNNATVQDTDSGLVWMRCTHGQVYRPTTNDCQGTGSFPLYGASTWQFCNTADDSCNDTIPGGETGATGHLNGMGTSSVFTQCDGYNAGMGTYGFTNWRAPWKEELKTLVYCSNGTVTPLADGVNCGAGYAVPVIDGQLFPDTPTGGTGTWSASARDATSAWYVNFSTGASYGGVFKTGANHVRCVAGP